jgi:Ca-activated chloride channel homolog
MTAEDRDAQLTAYALNDSSLTATAVQEVESLMATDTAARRAVEETRQLAQILTAGLTAEQAATPAETVVTIPMAKPESRKPTRWAKYVVAASVLCVVCAGVFVVWSKQKLERDQVYAAQQVAAAREPKTGVGNRGEVQFVEGETDSDLEKKRTGFDPDPAFLSKNLLTGPNGDVENLEGKPRDHFSSQGRPLKAGEAGAGVPSGAGAPAFPGGPFAGGGARPGMPRPAKPAVPGVSIPVTSPPTAEAVGLPDQPTDSKPLAPSKGDKGKADKDSLKELEERAKEAKDDAPRGGQDFEKGAANDRHPQMVENAFTKVEGQNALSTFGVDVDTASYAIVRNYLAGGQLPPPNAVRLEEMVNYFPYTDKAPEGNDPYAVTVEMADCPWAPTHRLVRLGLKAKPIDKDKRPPSNLVFLIDVSGSMNAENRLPLVKASLKLLASQLSENDRVALVVYAGTTGIVLDSTSAARKDKIIEALDRLEAGGSTNGSGGIQQAYEVATANFIKGGTNRVILCTDGDWNVGTTSTEALIKMIEEKRATGVYLSVFGFGMGNLRDEMLVQLAGKGNGNYGYIDTIKEAHKSFVEQLSGTLVTVAKDVKIQIEFNPAAVKSYRLLGYEKRILAAKDFHDDTKDAGEMGAGHVVTALYELVPAGVADPAEGKVDGLKYQSEPAAKKIKADEAFTLKMRHKKPDADTSTLREQTVKNVSVSYEKASDDFQFAAAVASFAMILRESQYKGQSNYGLVLELAEAAKKNDPSGYRKEFIELVKKAKTIAGK